MGLIITPVGPDITPRGPIITPFCYSSPIRRLCWSSFSFSLPSRISFSSLFVFFSFSLLIPLFVDLVAYLFISYRFSDSLFRNIDNSAPVGAYRLTFLFINSINGGPVASYSTNFIFIISNTIYIKGASPPLTPSLEESWGQRPHSSLLFRLVVGIKLGLKACLILAPIPCY